MRLPRLFLPCLLALSTLAPLARAEDPFERKKAPPTYEEEEAPPPVGNPFLGTSNNIGVELGFGFSSDSESDASILSIQPTLSGRFRLTDQIGLQVVLPMMYLSLSGGDASTSRFELGNPTVAAEFVLDQNGMAATFVRAGLALPLVSFPSAASLDDLEDIILQAANVSFAAGSRGFLDMWRYAPDSLGLFGEILGATDYDDLFMEFGAALALLIATSDNADTQLVLQAKARMGYGKVFKPFLGIGMSLIPTSDGDKFQFSVQGGGIIKAGENRFELVLNLNVDNPAGFSFDDGRVFGVRASAQIPF